MSTVTSSRIREAIAGDPERLRRYQELTHTRVLGRISDREFRERLEAMLTEWEASE